MTVQANYSNTASTAQISENFNASSPTLKVTPATFSGWPAAPCWAEVARGTAAAEVVLVTAIAGDVLSISRGQDGTGASDHNAGDTLEHIAPAVHFSDAETHEATATGVHGVVGNVVGTAGAQTVQDKAFRGGFKAQNSDTLPAGLTASYESVADSASARDGFVHRNTAGDANRRGLLIEQSGTPRVQVFNDGTVDVSPGTSTRPGFRNHANTQLDGALTVAGAANLAGASVSGNAVVGGTLGVTGATTVAGLSASGTVSAGALSSAGAITGSSAAVTGALSGASAAVTGAVTAGSVAAAGAVTGASAAISGAITAASASITGDVTSGTGFKAFGGSIPAPAVVTSLASVATPVTDQLVSLTTDHLWYRWNGSIWVPHDLRGFVGQTLRTTPDTTSGTAELICETVTASLIAGRRYEVTWDATYFCNTNTPFPVLRLRYAAGGAVTAADTLIRNKAVDAVVVGHSFTIIGTFVAPSTGTFTVGSSAQRASGTVTIQYSASTADRLLLLKDIGT